MKQNTTDEWQSRDLLLTTKRLCHLSDNHNLKRSVPLSKIRAVTIGNKDGTANVLDFIVHVSKEYDYFFYSN